MQVATIDFETYWDAECSVSKLSPLEYINHRDFEVISVSVKVDEYPTDVVFGEDDVRHALRSLNWSTKAALAHNMTGFDSYIMAYIYGINPRLWLDTAAMARPKHAKTCGVSLAKLVEHFKLGVKNNAVLMETKGRHFKDFTPSEIQRMGIYNKDDTEQCWALFKVLRQGFPVSELWQIDTLVRMRTEPKFQLDTSLLETAASVERDRKRAAMLKLASTLKGSDSTDTGFWENPDEAAWTDDATAEFVKAQLSSAAKFSALLTSLGVDVPMKASPTNPQNTIPALSKTDEAFVALQEHDNPLVAAAAAARLDAKSTLLETRLAKLLTAGKYAKGLLPIPLRYCGADTTGRDSGEEYNPQNFPAIRGAPKPSDAIRNSLRAPEGHKVIVADQSGIELRVNHFLWRVQESMDLYRSDPEADLYKAFAAARYKKPVSEVTKLERQLAKVAQLGLGFGAGWATFRKVAKLMGGLDLTDEESLEIVTAWREQYIEIAKGWRTCHNALSLIEARREMAVDPGGLVATCSKGFVLPSGRLICYPDLRQEAHPETGRPEWVYAHGRHKARIYAGKITENLVQALARDSIFDCSLEFFKLTGLRPSLRVHDELVYVVPDAQAEPMLAELQKLLRSPPKWWPSLVTWSEGDIAQTYGAAK